MRPLRYALCLLLLAGLAYTGDVFAAPKFPALTGRVVDGAHILSEPAHRVLEKQLSEYENGTSNQVVVVTLASLQGYPIEDFGYRLGRHWQIGQEGKDNGALLIVAPKEKQVRIEVGYGLEPLLTDAASSIIVNAIILPAFREGEMEKGVVEGVAAMLSVLGGKGIPKHARAGEMEPWQAWLVLMLLLWFFTFSFRHPVATSAMLMALSSRSGSSRLSGRGWGGGGGFRGGGGGFGGGGASGRW